MDGERIHILTSHFFTKLSETKLQNFAVSLRITIHRCNVEIFANPCKRFDDGPHSSTVTAPFRTLPAPMNLPLKVHFFLFLLFFPTFLSGGIQQGEAVVAQRRPILEEVCVRPGGREHALEPRVPHQPRQD